MCACSPRNRRVRTKPTTTWSEFIYIRSVKIAMDINKHSFAFYGRGEPMTGMDTIVNTH